LIAPEEILARLDFHLRHVEADEWLMVSEVAVAGFVNPNAIVKYLVDALMPRSCEMAD
jgi:hypothetical protein